MHPQGPSPILGAVLDFRDPINNSKWSCAEQSRDGEYVCAGAIVKDQHVIRVWESHGASLAVVLEGPPVGLRSVYWHPDPSRCALEVLFHIVPALMCQLAACPEWVLTKMCGLVPG
jgi:hypothetical protein